MMQFQTLEQNNSQLPQGPSVVTSIQALDQYGNVIASAQNPKFSQMMQE